MHSPNNFFRIYYKKIIIIFFLFHASAIAYWAMTPKIFEGSLAGYSDYLSDRKIKLIITELSSLLKKRQYRTLSKTLGLEEEKIKQISSLKVTTDFDENKSKTLAENAFTVTIQTKNAKLFKDYQKAIVNYINSNEYLQYRVRTAKMNLLSRQKSLLIERKFIDTLKTLILRKMSHPSSKFTLEDMDLGTLAKTSDELNDNAYKVEQEIIKNKALFITKQMNEFNLIVWPKLSVILFIAFCLSIASSVGFFIYKNSLK